MFKIHTSYPQVPQATQTQHAHDVTCLPLQISLSPMNTQVAHLQCPRPKPKTEVSLIPTASLPTPPNLSPSPVGFTSSVSGESPFSHLLLLLDYCLSPHSLASSSLPFPSSLHTAAQAGLLNLISPCPQLPKKAQPPRLPLLKLQSAATNPRKDNTCPPLGSASSSGKPSLAPAPQLDGEPPLSPTAPSLPLSSFLMITHPHQTVILEGRGSASSTSTSPVPRQGLHTGGS